MFALRLSFAACCLFLLVFQTCKATNYNYNSVCVPSSCGNINNISYPFRLVTDPQNCGDQRYSLSCEKNSAVLYLYSGRYYVQAINYNNFTIRVSYVDVHKDNCSSIPGFSLSTHNFLTGDPYTWYDPQCGSEWQRNLSQNMILLRCLSPVNSSLYVKTAPCIVDGVEDSSFPLKKHSYVVVGSMKLRHVKHSCSIEKVVLIPAKDFHNAFFTEIHNELAFGFELSWFNISGYTNRVTCSGRNSEDHFSIVIELMKAIKASISDIVVYLAIRTYCGTPCVIAILVAKWRRRHLSVYENIEEFLESHNNLMPIRYAYSDIMKMTGGFKDKLGEGGYGSVYRGKLRSGNFAAIKMLEKSETNGQDFINEVATIGRIHHVNVVQLIGFCVEGSKRALVYDFMPNGSLNKYTFQREGSVCLSWEKLFEISFGIARGIEYLHRGCDMQILHFDIKPHNILLDKDFIPKVSDFGLAKLYPTNDSIVSVTAARGTIGYMAPELFYKNIGHVSHKADVYSFGMLLLEMVGKRKNLNDDLTEDSSQYFPNWVYEQVSNGNDIETGDITEEENKIIKKMIVVGLWCIQMKPSNRPSMNRVVEMLEGNLESLQLPPRPVLYPEESVRDVSESSYSSSVLDVSTESTGLIMSFNHESMSNCRT